MKLLKKINPFLKLIRVHQYVKNTFIFLPLFFAGEITNLPYLFNATLAFIFFSIATSGIYIFNDFCDIEHDKLHPKKKFRPLACGQFSKKQALLFSAIFSTLGFFLMWQLSTKVLLILIIYFFLNIIYSLGLKKVALLDVFIISFGFIIRLIIGSVIDDIHLSKWIIIMTFLLALFITLAKRKDDMNIYIKSNLKMREVITQYNLQFIDTLMIIISSVIIVSYLLYTTSTIDLLNHKTNFLYISTVFVLIGIMRYLQLSIVFNNVGSPVSILFKDKVLQLSIFFWLLFYMWVIYL